MHPSTAAYSLALGARTLNGETVLWGHECLQVDFTSPVYL